MSWTPPDPSSEPGWGDDGGWAPPPAVDPPPLGDPASPYGGPAGYGPPPAYGPPAGYGQAPAHGYQPAYGYGQVDHPKGTTVLVLGILSLVLGFACGVAFVLGPIAWILGNDALKDIDASPGRYGNRGQVQAGRVCGIVATVILLLGVLLLVAIFGVTAVGTSAS